MPSNRYYVYGLFRPDDIHPFYVGKGTGLRYKDHFRDKDRDSNFHKRHIIQQIIKSGSQPTVVIFNSELTEDTAYAIEAMMVSIMGREGIDPTGVLTNRAPGGRAGCIDPARGVAVDVYSLDDIFIRSFPSITAAAIWANPENIISAISSIHSCIKKSISVSAYGYKWCLTGGTPKSYSSKIIYEWDSYGKLVATHTSIDSIIKQFNISKSTVHLVLNGSQPGYSGGEVLWTNVPFLDPLKLQKFQKMLEVKNPRKAKIYHWSLDGELLNTFLDAYHAAEQTNIPACTILEVCKKRQTQTAGNVFTFDDSFPITPILQKGSNKMRTVICITTGQTFTSLTEAEKFLKVPTGGISAVCSGKQKTAGGYVFKYG